MAVETNKPNFQYVWASGGAKVAPSDVKIQDGWGAEVPPLQWENWSQNRQDEAIVHLFQKGISEWDSLSNYYFTAAGVRSYVQGSDGQIYVAVADNIGQNPVTDTSNTYWTLAFNNKSSSRVSGLIGNNNVTTPNTQFDFSAASVTLRNPTTGYTAVLTNTGTITNNILTAGPIANGRDQVGAFSNSSWIHFHFIYNGTTLATISSTSATAPTLPAGYSYAAYAHAVYLGSGGLLTKGFIRGSWFQYETSPGAVNNGNSTGLTSIPVTTMVPPNALQFELWCPNLALTALASGAYNLQCNIVISGTAVAVQFGMQGTGAANGVTGVSGAVKRLQNINQNFAYQLVVGAGVGYIVTLGVSGYSVPNGGE
jgi:hypothetical protein